MFIRQKTEFIRNMKKYDYAEIDFWVRPAATDIRREFSGAFQNWRSDIKIFCSRTARGKEKSWICADRVSCPVGRDPSNLIDQAFDLDNYFDAARAAVKDKLAPRSAASI